MAGEAVLLVEKEPQVREFLEQQLTDDGFEVLAAERARQALELLETAKPDLVLLDAVLPDASGFEVCSRLRAGEPGCGWNRDVPVIMVSSRADPIDRVRGFARGADDYVVKPFVYEELEGLISTSWSGPISTSFNAILQALFWRAIPSNEAEHERLTTNRDGNRRHSPENVGAERGGAKPGSTVSRGSRPCPF